MSTTTCRELIDTRGGDVICDGKWRTNYPYGRKSRGRTIMIREHHDGCKFKRRTKRKRR